MHELEHEDDFFPGDDIIRRAEANADRLRYSRFQVTHPVIWGVVLRKGVFRPSCVFAGQEAILRDKIVRGHKPIQIFAYIVGSDADIALVEGEYEIRTLPIGPPSPAHYWAARVAWQRAYPDWVPTDCQTVLGLPLDPNKP